MDTQWRGLFRTKCPTRQSNRVRLSQSVGYACGDGGAGPATVVDLSLGGLRIRSPRFFPPKSFLLLHGLDAPQSGHSGELKTQVVWCRPAQDLTVFETGLRVLFDDGTAPRLLEDLAEYAGPRALESGEEEAVYAMASACGA